jgi:hypothetical protein
MTRSRPRIHPPAIALLAALALLAAAPSAWAQAELTLIADETTPVPGFPMETYSEFGEGKPVISGSDVSFYGGYPSGSGIYVGDGTAIEIVADQTTDDPEGSAETFQPFPDWTWIDGPFVSFVGLLLGQPGVYLANGSAIGTVVERGDPVPGSAETFEELRDPTTSSGVVAFLGEASGGGTGVYLVAGPVVTVADETTPIPGGSGETFDSFDTPIASGTEVAFVGSNFMAGRVGLYVGSGGPLTVVADDTTSPPGTTETFNAIGEYSFDDGAVAFVGSGSGFFGIYLSNGSDLSVVADLSTPRPGGGTFTNFEDVALSQGNVLFRDGDDLFFWDGGTIQRVLGAGDVVGGKAVDTPFLGAGGLDGCRFTVAINFTDDSVAIYRGEVPVDALDIAEVPTLGEWGLILLALSLAAAAAFVLRA